MRSTKSEISVTTRISGITIGASAFFQRTAILHVMTNAIRVLEPGMGYLSYRPASELILMFVDGTERQVIKDMDGNVPRPKIRACSISDPFVLIIREDDSIGMFIGETERGKIRRKDMSPMGDKVWFSVCTRVSFEHSLMDPLIDLDLSILDWVFLLGYVQPS